MEEILDIRSCKKVKAG